MLENDVFHSHSPSHHRAAMSLAQFGLFELFFVTTWCAVLIGVYIYISPVIVFVAGGWLISIGVLHVLRPQNLLTGGLLGFAIAGSVAAFILWTLNFDLNAIPIAVLFPTAGYFYGACKAEWRDDCI